MPVEGTSYRMVGFIKPTIKRKDIEKQEEKMIMDIVKDSFKKCKTEKEMAEYLKLTLDDMYGGPWNVIVGERFGGVVTHIPKHFIYFNYKKKDFLIYCTKNMKGVE